MSEAAGSCHCGAVEIRIGEAPEYINECNCSLCSKHGALWGYFEPDRVRVFGATEIYCRSDRAEPTAALHFCAVCGCTTHWTATPAFIRKFGIANRMGVNFRLFEPSSFKGVELRFPDGRAWDGSADWDFVRPPTKMP
ncbi:MAG: aldehyde-activating protein [Sphingomonadales bacterium]|nr:aldehyde-activating protein [Sphingomonadales bacterium]